MRREPPAAGRQDIAPTPEARPRRIGRPRRAGVEERVAQHVLASLERDGYARLRIDDVAAAAGVAKTTLYRRWPSKEALVADAVSRLYLDRVQSVEHGDLRSDFAALLGETRQLLFDGTGRVMEDLVRESGTHPELAGIVRATNDARRRSYREAIDRAVERGELDPGVDHDLVIDLLVGPLWTRLLVTGGVVTGDEVERIVAGVVAGLGVTNRRGASPEVVSH